MKGKTNGNKLVPTAHPAGAARLHGAGGSSIAYLAPLDIFLDDMPPSSNNAYTTGKGHGRRVLTTDARRWKESAIKQIRVTAGRAGWSMAPKTPMQIMILFRAPNILVWDLDGKVKLLQDAFCEAVGLNDAYVMDLHLRKRRWPNEQVCMRVMEWSEDV